MNRPTRSPIGKNSIVPPLAMMALMLGVSSIPGVAGPDDPPIFGWFYWLAPQLQNLLHVPVYALLAWLWMRYLRGSGKTRRCRTVVTGLICVAFAIAEESYQQFVPGRYPSLVDLTYDVLGVALGLGLHDWLGKTRGRLKT